MRSRCSSARSSCRRLSRPLSICSHSTAITLPWRCSRWWLMALARRLCLRRRFRTCANSAYSTSLLVLRAARARAPRTTRSCSAAKAATPCQPIISLDRRRSCAIASASSRCALRSRLLRDTARHPRSERTARAAAIVRSTHCRHCSWRAVLRRREAAPCLRRATSTSAMSWNACLSIPMRIDWLRHATSTRSFFAPWAREVWKRKVSRFAACFWCHAIQACMPPSRR
mmetsp:Transcript_16383/g.42852  ORF Transcript_16383/g.42852 Transcript_16383/m.42852 type:complete len:228 (-) Transcript_16383:919-1602(-)